MVPIAERAIGLDPKYSKGHCSLGMCNLISRNYDTAEFNFQSALKANPNDDLAHTGYGRFLMYIDRPEDGLLRIREAMRLNPFHPNWYWSIQGRCLHTLARYDEAIRAFERMANPPFYIFAYLAACYTSLGQKAEAETARRRLFEAPPNFDLHEFELIFPYQNEDTAIQFFAELHSAGINTRPT